MLDSAARAERIDLSSTEAAFYTWEVAQKPVAVRLPLTLIDRLESEAVENFRSLSSRGSEIGGLLLGSVLPGNPATVTATDFELVACDYSRGPLYRFGDADLGRVEQAIEKHNSGSGPRVIGFFRSHTRKGLTVDGDDLAFFEPRFPEPHQIVLLIRPFATKVSSAAIFIRENGKIATEASHREFPFRSSELTAPRSGGERADGISSPAPVAPTAAPATPAKPQARAQIVPIASRREITLPEPVVSAPVPPPLVAERIEAPAPPPALAKAQTPAPVLEKPVIEKPAAEKPAVEKPAVEKEDKEKEKAVAPPAPLVEPAVETAAPAIAASDIVLPIPARKNKKLRLMVAAAVGMLVVAGSLVVYPMLTKHPAPPRGAAQQDSSPLSLRVERTSGGMLLTWNRDLPVIQGATKVVLSISDGDRHENIQLDPNQVRTGSILYPPMTGDVSFQMEVTDPNQAKTTSESLRVLDPRPSPLDDPAAKQAAAKETTPAKPAATDPVPVPTEEAKAVEETPASHPAAALKPFNTASLAQRLRPASTTDVPLSPTDLPDAPVIGRSSAPTSASLPGIEISQPAAPAPPRPVAPSTTTPAPSLKTGGQLIPAKVISRVDPEYPKLARQAGASGMVELEATISADGKVKNPRVVHGNSMLQKAAIDAVLQWHYQPAMLNGRPVESPVEIKLNFVASR
jgi:TonB family protein